MSEGSTPGTLLLCLANEALRRGKHRTAASIAERAWRQAAGESDEKLTVSARAMLGIILCISRRDREALPHLAAVVATPQRLTDDQFPARTGVAYGHLIASSVRSAQVELDACLRLADEAVAWSERIRSVSLMISLRSERGRVHEARGELDRAIQDQDAAVALRREQPGVGGYSFPDLAARLAAYLVERAGPGDLERARALLNECVDHPDLISETSYRCGRARAALATREGRWETAEEDLLDALAAAQSTEGAGPLLVLGDIAELLVSRGRLQDADRRLRETAAEALNATSAVCESERVRLLDVLVRLRLAQARDAGSDEAHRMHLRARRALARLRRSAERLARLGDRRWLAVAASRAEELDPREDRAAG